MSLFSRTFLNKIKIFTSLKANEYRAFSILSIRHVSHNASLYDTDRDPAPIFFHKDIQKLLKLLTRSDYEKVFRKRTNKNISQLETPTYKFMTDEQLNQEIANAEVRAEKLLAMPPVVKIRASIDKILSQDPAITAHDKAKYVFTDITFGVSNKDRLIVERDVNGTLRYGDHQMRKRLNQAYFPLEGRSIKEPLMFTDDNTLKNLLDNQSYEFVLDRACIQYEPDEPEYQHITSIAYQHCDTNKAYNHLRSTRHFGPMVFYLAWHRSIDGLILDILQSGVIREAVLVITLRHELHNDLTQGEDVQSLVKKILSAPLKVIKLKEGEEMSEANIQLNMECIQCVERYIANNSIMKGLQELALQSFREYFDQQVELHRGVKKAHGVS